MNIIEKARVQAFHRHRLPEGGTHALGFREPKNQTLRFQKLIEWGDMSGLTIMDLGCGYGDLKPFLDQKFSEIYYLGVDFLPNFIEGANERYGHLANSQFICADFMTAGLPEVDIVLASGSLNYRSTNVLHPWQSISTMWNLARKGIAFNLLDKKHFLEDELLVGYDPHEVINFCRQLCANVTCIQDYLPDDFTVLMYK